MIISCMKRTFSRGETVKKMRKAAIADGKTGVRGGKRYVCCKCKKDFAANEIQVDHINPVIPVTKSALDMSLDAILKRLFVKQDKLQVMCKDCHNVKSKAENAKRRANKKKLKDKADGKKTENE